MSRPQDIRVMRSEITTLEQFKAIGVAGRVAIRYGVDHGDAVKLYRELEAKAKEEGEMSKNKEAEKRVRQMQAEITTAEQFKAIGNTDKVARKYNIGKSTAAAHLTKLIKEKGQQIPTPTQPDSAPSEPEGVAESDYTCEPVSVVCAPNLSEREEFFAEPEPDLSAVKTSNALALELIAKVNQEAVASVQSRIRAYFVNANKAMDELLKTESKIDHLMYEIQVDLLKVVERELGVALEVGK